MEHLDTFLAGYPPFDALSPQQLRDLVAAGVVQDHATGALLLVEDGPPASALWVILTGSMDLMHQGEVVQILEPGECFGQASLLTGMAPAFSVRAREPCRSFRLAAAAARAVLGTEAGAAYVAQSLRKRITSTGQTVHALQEVGTTPVSAIMRPAVFAADTDSLGDAALRLSQNGTGALVVGRDEAPGIVTDADIRAAVAGGRFSADAPVRTIARAPAPTVSVSQPAIEATIDMITAGVEHLVVVDHGRVCGVVSAADLLALEARSPIGLRHTILEAADESHLAEAVSRLPQQFLALARAGLPPRELGRVLSLAQDSVVARLIQFSIGRIGPAPLPWAWLDLGSAARREFTLASDQDNALAYGPPLAGTEAAADEYFARLGDEVNAGLARCGIGIDNNGVLAGNRQWRMSKPDWLRTFDECLTQPDESHLVRATVAFDFRSAAGGLAVDADLTARVRRARSYPQFMQLIARAAAGFPVSLNFRGQLASGHHGEPAGRLDVKRGGIIPAVNVVRYHALATGVTISPTIDRIEAIAGAGGLSQDDADALQEAFEVITRVRFEHHAELISAGQSPDNLIDPGALAPIARTELRAALQAVRRAQRRLPA
jgi:CBS domain-containing protein